MGERVEVKINPKHGELSDPMQESMREKLGKLPRFFEGITGI